jgi:uncharacterized RDD family membrane protein YckC
MNDTTELEYVGFWPRVWASIIDTIMIMVVTSPLAAIVYGRGYFSYDYGAAIRGPEDFFISFVLPAVAVILFWSAKHATPGKMAIGAKIVDARTGGSPSLSQHIIRYLGYFVSILPACLGLVWVAFDSRKQGWHDKLAGTVVVRPRHRGPEPVRFGNDRSQIGS